MHDGFDSHNDHDSHDKFNASRQAGKAMQTYSLQMSSIWDSVLKDKNVPVTLPNEYSEYTDISSPDSTAELPKHTSINDYPISLVNDLLSYPPALRYRSSTRKTVAFDCVSEVSIT